MFKIVLLIALMGACVLVVAGEYFTSNGLNYYYSHPIRRNWFKAYQYCATLGMHLIDMRTEEEFNRIKSLLHDYNLRQNITDASYIWSSGTDQGDEGNFYWMGTGVQIHFENWRGDQPDNHKNIYTNETDNCMCFGSKLVDWEDEYCSKSFSFICRDLIDVPQYEKKSCSIYADMH